MALTYKDAAEEAARVLKGAESQASEWRTLRMIEIADHWICLAKELREGKEKKS